MEVIVSFLLGLWMGLGLPVVERGETANCRPSEEARIVYQDLTRPYAEEAYYPVMGCRP